MKRAASDRGMKRAASDRGLWFEDCSPVQYPRKCWKAIENDKSAPELPEALKQDLGDMTFRKASS